MENNFSEKIKKIVKSENFKISVYVLAGILVLLFVFQAGMFVGFKKASFSFGMGENYFREMNGRQNDPMMGLQRGDFGNAHGAIGQIVGLNLPNIVVEDRDGANKTVNISSSTSLKGVKGNIKAEDLKLNDHIVVFGSSNNDSVVDARLIRMMPPPPAQEFRESSSTNAR